MLEDQILESQDSKSRNNDSARNSESEHKLILNETSPNMKQCMFMKYRCGGSPRVLTKSIPRRHKNLFRYKINKSLNFEIGSKKSDSHHLSNASLNNDSFDINKPSRNLSRSAKIMKALSFDRDSFYHGSSNIKKSLTFDSTPSPTGNSSSSSVGSFHANSKISTPSPSPILDNVLRLSTSSNDSSVSSILIASSDSIDENQNRTPQQNRKIARHNSDKSESSNSASSHSLLRSNLKEKIDEIVLMSNLQSLERDNSISKAINSDIVTSTPRNLFHEFNEIDCDRPHTPENMIRLIPESMSAIKKSHKKERSYTRSREQSAKQQNISIRTQDLNTKTIESSEMDDASTSNSCNMSFISEESTKKDQPQKKNTNVKKMLVYNLDNEFFNIESSSAQKDTPKNIDSDDACVTSQENLQNSGSTSPSLSHYEHKDKENDSNTNVSKEEECQLLSQKESSNDNNADVMVQGNMAESLESNPTTPPNVNKVVTPKNHENILEHVFTESIKKSHRKVKHENSKSLFKSMIFHHETTISKLEALNQSTRDSNDNQYADINSTSMNETCNSSLQNSARSHTPENVNSSRLLLSQFLSVKKSHRKNKNKKLIQKINKSVSSSRCHDEYHERERNVNLLQDNKYKQDNISKILYRDESHELKESFSNVSPIKKTKTMNISLQSITDKFSNSSTMLSPECENEFRIYTPIRRKRMSSAIVDCVCADETSLEKYNSAQISSKEVDFSRCETPIAHCSYRSNIKAKRSESSTHKEHANIDKSENDALITADNEPENITYDENGRSTPLNMSTTELLSNMNSIKKSHKKNKHDGLICKRRIFEKEQSYTKKTRDINMEKRTIPSLKLNLDDDICNAEMGVCSNKNNDNDKEHETTNVYDDSQPSTSGKSDGIESKINAQVSKLLNTTPPNSWNTGNFIKLLHTTSIKRSHKKERHRNAQDKYIFMSEEYDLSDDGSIFEEEDRLNSVESFDLCQDNNEEIRS